MHHQRLLILTGIMLVRLTFSVAQSDGRPTERLVFQPNDTQRCLKCHGMANFAFRDSSSLALHNYTVNVDTFRNSIHGKLHCQQCHTEIKEYPHAFARARTKVACGTDCHAKDSTGKAYTHAQVANDFGRSIHKRGLTDPLSDSPTCTTCHGNRNPHAVAKAQKSMAVREKMALCVECHDDHTKMVINKVDPDAVSSYKRSFHYKAIRFGGTNTAVCQDCHTVHSILPQDSIQSSISVTNIAKTCGQEKCHPEAQMNFAMSGANHLSFRIEKEWVLKFEEQFFLVLTGGTMLMLLIGIVLDIQRKFGWITIVWKLIRWMGEPIGGILKLRVPVGRFMRKVLID